MTFEQFWWFLVAIGAMITLHELGHFWAARFFDVKVDAFSFGFGPRLFGFRRGETDFRFSLVPLGGYVKMAGEQFGDETAIHDPRSFIAKPRWQRLIIAFAGPAMNIVLAVAILTGLFMYRYPKILASQGPAVVGSVQAGSPAAKAGLLRGDTIVQVGEQRNPTWEDVMVQVALSAKGPLTLGVDRNGQRQHVTFTPAADESGQGLPGFDEQHEVQIMSIASGGEAEKAGLKLGDIILALNGDTVRSTSHAQEIIQGSNGNPIRVEYLRDGQKAELQARARLESAANAPSGSTWRIGVGLGQRVVYTQLGFGPALVESIKRNYKSTTQIYEVLRAIVMQRLSAKSLEGPIGIARQSGEALRHGPWTFLSFVAAVSLNLAIFNLLPIPILDGGLIMMLLVEMVMGRDLSLQLKENLFKVALVFLMMLVVFVLYNDISKARSEKRGSIAPVERHLLYRC